MNDPGLEEATSLERSGAFAASLSLIAPLASRAREAGALLWACELTLRESRLLVLTEEDELAIARVAWVMSRADAPEHRETFREEKAAWTIAMSFLMFANAAKNDLRLSFQSVLTVLTEADRFLESAGRVEWKAGVSSERAGIYERMGRSEDAVEEGRRAVDLKLRCPGAPSHTLSAMQRNLARRLQRVGQVQEAMQLLLSLRQTEVYGVLDQLGVESALGHLALEVGDLPLAEQAATRALELTQGAGPSQRIAAAGVAVEVFLALARLPEARAAAKEVRAAAELMASPAALCAAAQDEFDVALACGETERAALFLTEMEAQAQVIAARGGASPLDEVEARRAKLAPRLDAEDAG